MAQNGNSFVASIRGEKGIVCDGEVRFKMSLPIGYITISDKSWQKLFLPDVNNKDTNKPEQCAVWSAPLLFAA